MKREALKALGLTDEQIDSVLDAHKLVIKDEYVPIHRLTEATDATKAAEALVKTQKDQIKELEGFEGTNEELKSTLATMETARKEAEKVAKKDKQDAATDLAKERKKFALKTQLLSEDMRPHDVELVAGMFDLDKIDLGEDGTIESGYSERRDTLTEEKSFLFTEEAAETQHDGVTFLGKPPVDGDKKTEPTDRQAGFGEKMAQDKLKRQGIDVKAEKQ